MDNATKAASDRDPTKAGELLRMAIAASARNDGDASIAHLKRAIELDDRSAEARYMLGAEYASRGEYELAVTEMQAALKCRPEFAIARFQLGLLLMTLARVADAASTWGLLDALPPEHPLVLFKSGLMHLVREDFARARSCLQAGIEANTENPPLNRDMRLVIERIDRQQAQAGASDGGEHLLVSAYRDH